MAGFLQVFILHLLLKRVYEIQSQVIDQWMAGFLHENRTWIGLIYYYSWYCYLKSIQIIPLPLRLQRPVKTGLNQFCAVFVFSNLWLTVNRTAVLTEDRSIPFAVFIGYGLVRLRFFSGFVTGLPNTTSVTNHTILNGKTSRLGCTVTWQWKIDHRQQLEGAWMQGEKKNQQQSQSPNKI